MKIDHLHRPCHASIGNLTDVGDTLGVLEFHCSSAHIFSTFKAEQLHQMTLGLAKPGWKEPDKETKAQKRNQTTCQYYTTTYDEWVHLQI